MGRYAFFLFFTATLLHGQSKVNTLKVQGNTKTKTSFVRKMTELRVGQTLDSMVLEKDMGRLIRLPSVAHAYYQIKKADNGIDYDVVYGIKESFTIIPFANIFTSSNDEFAFRVGLQEFNFLGQGITLGAFYQYDIFNSYGLNFRAPYLFSDKLGLAVSYQDLTTQEPVFLENGTADYKYNNTSAEVLALYQLSYKNRVEFGINRFSEDYQYIFGATDASVPQDLNVAKLLYKFIYDFDGVTYYYHYLNGFKSTLNFQYVTSTSNQLPDFLIGFNDFSYYQRVGKKGNWASRVRLGLASNVKTPFAPFAVDNNLNIRGVGNTIDRGTGAIVLNTEYRHSLIENDWLVLQSNIFLDAGSWRNPGGDFTDFTNNQNLRIYPGVGLRFIHKNIFNAIFRVDYGHGITKDATKGIVFGIGQYF